MALRYNGIGDGCPYDLVSGGITGCARFDPQIVFDRPGGAILACTHARCSIARPGNHDGSAATFYLRCLLRTGDLEAERDFAVPLD